jgi:hypothetical protein
MAPLNAPSEWDFDELLDHPNRPLTKEQWNNFDRFLREPNDDKSAADVDIGPEVEKVIAEIERKKSYWW